MSHAPPRGAKAAAASTLISSASTHCRQCSFAAGAALPLRRMASAASTPRKKAKMGGRYFAAAAQSPAASFTPSSTMLPVSALANTPPRHR